MEKSGDLSGPAGICGDLWGSVGICRDLQGSVWLHTLRHSAIWLWGPASSPVLQPLAPGKFLSRTGRTAPLRTLMWTATFHYCEMPQTTSSKKPTFICIDVLDEFVAEHQVNLLNSPNQILIKFPSTGIFSIRPCVQNEIGKRLPGRVTTICIVPKRCHIIRYLRNMLDEDTTPDGMDCSLKTKVLEKAPKDVSERYYM